MPNLLVRRLLVDLAAPFDRHWNGGDPLRTAIFNSLSMSFPLGEQFFIDSIRAGVGSLPASERERFACEVQGFIGQEATHRRIHGQFNAQLEAQGHVNVFELRILQRLPMLKSLGVRHLVAMTAATEHLTAIFCRYLLSTPEALAGTEQRLLLMWHWHAAEELEHRSTAFDVYQALGGNNYWRRRWFLVVTVNFTLDAARQATALLRRDRELWRWCTWRSAIRFLFGPRGLARHAFRSWLDYLRADFHPSHHDDAVARRWLSAQAAHYKVVGSGASDPAPATAPPLPNRTK
jgi:predicted metal-dependent hydrolase